MNGFVQIVLREEGREKKHEPTEFLNHICWIWSENVKIFSVILLADSLPQKAYLHVSPHTQ